MREIFINATRQLSQLLLTDDDISFIHLRVERVYSLLVRCTSQFPGIDKELIHVVEKALDVTANATEDVYCGYVSPLLYSGKKGRPAFNITRAQFSSVSYNFKIPLQMTKSNTINTTCKNN